MIRWIGKTGLVSESDCVVWWFKVMYRFSRWTICDRTGLLLSDNMNDMFVCVSGELSCRSCHGILRKCSIFFWWWSFWSDPQLGNGNGDSSASRDEWKCSWWRSDSDSGWSARAAFCWANSWPCRYAPCGRHVGPSSGASRPGWHSFVDIWSPKLIRTLRGK